MGGLCYGDAAEDRGVEAGLGSRGMGNHSGGSGCRGYSSAAPSVAESVCHVLQFFYNRIEYCFVFHPDR